MGVLTMMPKNFVRQMAVLFMGLALAGCVTDTAMTTPVATEPDLVSTRIAQAAEKASQSLNTIAGIEQQRSPAPFVEDYSSAPSIMTQAITVKWTGPIEQISQSLASRAGLRFRTKGNPPPVPLTVVIDAYQQPLVEVLRDIGLQAGHRADITVDGQSGFVEIRYAPVDKI
jgi:defect in organelle trafficking protein DotD